MNPTYGTSPLVCEYVGYVVYQTGGVPTANTVLGMQAKNSVPVAANGAGLGQQFNIGPDARIPVVLFPTTVYHPAVASNTANTVIMLDCRQFNADIIYASAAYCPPPGATAGQLPAVTATSSCNMLAIDNINKFIYFVVITPSNAALNPSVGASLQFDVAFKDTPAI